jgi:hypothetical protein
MLVLVCDKKRWRAPGTAIDSRVMLLQKHLIKTRRNYRRRYTRQYHQSNIDTGEKLVEGEEAEIVLFRLENKTSIAQFAADIN